MPSWNIQQHMKLNWVYTLPQQVRVEKANYEKSSVREKYGGKAVERDTIHMYVWKPLWNHSLHSSVFKLSACIVFVSCLLRPLCTVCEKECEDLRAMRQRRSDHTHTFTPLTVVCRVASVLVQTKLWTAETNFIQISPTRSPHSWHDRSFKESDMWSQWQWEEESVQTSVSAWQRRRKVAE